MKKLFFLTAFLCAVGSCYGQDSPTDYPEVVPPPPSVASLMRFEEVPVDYYTGQPNITLPLGNMKIHKDLSYPIALRYNTQALRVDERSGWTGTGFTLTSAGTISRTIKGLPDELNHPLKGTGIFHNNYYNWDIMSQEAKNEFMWNVSNGNEADRLDADQDLYQYSYLGGSGRFIIVKQSNALTAIITESETNDKINLTYDTNFKVTQFEIIDTKGYRYIFDVSNENQITSYTSATPQSGSGSTVSGDYMGANNVPNAWYLTKILQPNDQEICRFVYQDVTESFHTPYSSMRYALQDQNDLNVGSTTQIRNYNNSVLKPKLLLSSQSITSTQKYLDTIVFRDNSKVVFSLTNDHPEYGGTNNGARLNTIKMFEPNGSLNKRVELDYYTTQNDKLFLTEVKEVYGTGNELTYTLDYNNADELPEFDDVHQDVFGYYNGQDSDNPFQIISLADPEKATTGAISSITYPTGGKKEFVFESNSYGYEGTTVVDTLEIPQNRVGIGRMGTLTITLLDQVSSGAYLLYMDTSQKMMVNTSIVSSGSGANPSKHRIRFHKAKPKPGVTITDPTGVPNYSNYNINDFQYDTNGTVRELPLLNTNTMSGLPGGWYFIELTTPQVEFPQFPSNITLDFTINHSTFQLNTVNKKGGGIRIKEILFTDEGVEKRKIEYVYLDNPHIHTSGPSEHVPHDYVSSGSFEVNPNTRSYTKTETHPFVSGVVCWTNGQGQHTYPGGVVSRAATDVTYTVTRDISAIYTPNTKGNYVGYRYVLRKESGNGSELFTYTSPREVQIQVGSGVATYPFKPEENLDYKRGVLEKRQVFLEKQSGETIPKLLQEQEYDYFDVSSVVRTSVFTYEHQGFSCPWDQFYDRYVDYTNGAPGIAGNAINLFEPCGMGVTEDLDIGNCTGNPDMTWTTYQHIRGIKLAKEVINRQFFYDGSTLSHTVVSTDNMSYNSKNRISEQTTQINEGGSLVTLKQKMFYPYNEPFLEFTTSERAVFDLMVAKNIIEVPVYTESERNTNLLSKVKTRFSQASTNNFQPSNTEVFKANESEGGKIIFTSYDEFGNLRGVTKENGTQVVYIWGYNKTVPVAKIENATYSQISSYISGIESASNSDNDRTLDIVSSSDAITYVGNEGALRQAINSIRTGLPNAMVTSYTYDPLIGVTSVTDPRGQTVYYHYDDYNRLESVKDAYGKIVSENKYNYKN